ncbi:MAG: outer membrane protein assembly factor BamD [Syntrophobacteraceae bacterium]
MHAFLKNRKNLSRLGLCLAITVMILGSAGCGGNLWKFYFGDLFGKGSSADKNASQLAEEGTEKMAKKDYTGAIKAFQKLKEQYPYSKYSLLAELKIGDAHFEKGEYSEAAVAYEEFARLHPRNEIVPFVLYQVGLCHFLSFSSIERDQSETQLAIEAFQRVMQAFPESEYAGKARKQLLECQKRIVAHEYYVGEFYHKQKRYRSAKQRLEKISKDYPQAIDELGYKKSVEEMLADCEKHAGEDQHGPSIWTRMGF